MSVSVYISKWGTEIILFVCRSFFVSGQDKQFWVNAENRLIMNKWMVCLTARSVTLAIARAYFLHLIFFYHCVYRKPSLGSGLPGTKIPSSHGSQNKDQLNSSLCPERWCVCSQNNFPLTRRNLSSCTTRGRAVKSPSKNI